MSQSGHCCSVILEKHIILSAVDEEHAARNGTAISAIPDLQLFSHRASYKVRI
jgi:hypothetical protein